MRIVLASIVSLMCCNVAPVCAQLSPEAQTGSRIPVKPAKVDPERAGFITKGFARCIYSRNSALALKLVQHSDSFSIDYQALQIQSKNLPKLLGMENCLGEQGSGNQIALGFRSSASTLRTMMVEEAYLSKKARAVALPADATESVVRSYVSKSSDLNKARDLAAFSDCVVFNDWAIADALLRTMPGSKDERLASRALAPTLGKCLSTGQTITFTPASIRAMMADGLWARFGQPDAGAAVTNK